MADRPILVIHQMFADLPDPRVERTKRHALLDLITIAVCAVVSGADAWVDVEGWGLAKQEWLASFLTLSGGIPSHDTFGRVFARLDPAAFERCFLGWVQTVLPPPPGEMIAIDGKVLRRSHDRGARRASIDLVSAWAEDRRLVLGQQAVEATSNEITAVPALLDLLILEGGIVTVDALHCQIATAATIRSKGADYVFALKTNQPQTHDTVETFFAEAVREDWQSVAHEQLVTKDAGHGRLETRRYWTSADPQLLAYLGREIEHWLNLGCVGMVERERVAETGTSRETSYYLSGLDGSVATFARAVRSHWGIENREHWVLDVAFREDESRVRTGDGAENLGLLRRIAINLIRLDRSRKGSVHTKRLTAGWDQTYLLQLLSPSVTT